MDSLLQWWVDGMGVPGRAPEGAPAPSRLRTPASGSRRNGQPDSHPRGLRQGPGAWSYNGGPMTGSDRRWLFGPVPDLLFGCGGLYAAFFLLQTFAGDRMREVFPLEYQPFLTLALGTPHYGATLLRVYERAEDRRRYAIFAVYATIALAVAFVVGLHVAAFGSLLVTIYFTWSPWHYSGQNYGIALMFLRRRGVMVTAAAKRFLIRIVPALVRARRVADPRSGSLRDVRARSYTATLYRVVPIGIPHAGTLLVACALAYAATTLGAAALLLRRASSRDLAPAAALVGLQALWFAAPVCARTSESEPRSIRSRAPRTRSCGCRRDTSCSICGSPPTTRRSRTGRRREPGPWSTRVFSPKRSSRGWRSGSCRDSFSRPARSARCPTIWAWGSWPPPS